MINPKMFFLLATAILLSSCVGTPAEATQNIQEESIVISTQTTMPTSVLTQAPLPTATEVPGFSFSYSVKATSHESISVMLAVSNITSNSLILYRLATPELSAIPPISGIAVEDRYSNALTFELEEWNGFADRHLEILTINTVDTDSILLTYELDLGVQTAWNATPQYIAVAENQIFFQADPDNVNIELLEFQFEVPENWNVVTRLTPAGEKYSLDPRDTFRVVARNTSWQRFALAAPLLLGEYDTIETQHKNIRMIAAYPRGNSRYEKDASYVGPIFQYQIDQFGDPGLFVDDYAVLIVFGPKIPGAYPGGLIPTVVSHGTFEVDHVDDNRHLGHEMYHMWWGDGNFIPDAFRFVGFPAWFVEGTNEYLGVKAHLATGAFSPAMANQWHVDFYLNYRGLAGSDNDVPVGNCLDALPPGSTDWYTCLYSKSHTVLFLLDESLQKITDGNVGLEDLILSLIEAYSDDPTWILPEKNFEMMASDISGHDFETFFEAYIFGTEILPVSVQDGKLIVNWSDVVGVEN